MICSSEKRLVLDAQQYSTNFSASLLKLLNREGNSAMIFYRYFLIHILLFFCSLSDRRFLYINLEVCSSPVDFNPFLDRTWYPLSDQVDFERWKKATEQEQGSLMWTIWILGKILCRAVKTWKETMSHSQSQKHRPSNLLCLNNESMDGRGHRWCERQHAEQDCLVCKISSRIHQMEIPSLWHGPKNVMRML